MPPMNKSEIEQGLYNLHDELNMLKAELREHIDKSAFSRQQQSPLKLEMNRSVWRYLPPEIDAIVIDKDDVWIGKSGECFDTTDPKQVRILRRPKEERNG